MMAKQIVRMRGKFKDSLDIGTGTGVLAAVAWRAGSEKIVGLDREKIAVETARENLRLNGCQNLTLFGTDLAKYSLRTQFDLVTANLATDPLVKYRKKIVARVRPGKYLLISGILKEHLKTIEEAFALPILGCERQLVGKKWVALLFRRKK